MRASKPVICLCLFASVLYAAVAIAETGVRPFAIDAVLDVGESLTLQSDATKPTSPGWFQKLNLDEKPGADSYRDNISGSSSRTISVGDIVEQKKTGTWPVRPIKG